MWQSTNEMSLVPERALNVLFVRKNVENTEINMDIPTKKW